MEISSNINRAFLDHWTGLCAADGTPPLRSMLDPLSVDTRVLPHLFLTEIETDPFKVIIRLQGEFLINQAGQNLRNKAIGPDTFGENWRAVEAIYRDVVENQKASITMERQTGPHDWHFVAEILHAPLIGEDGAVTHVCGSFDRIGHRDVEPAGARGPERWEVLDRNALGGGGA